MAGFKDNEPRDFHGRWTKAMNSLRAGLAARAEKKMGVVREKLTGSADKRPFGEVAHGAVMRRRWERQETNYDVKYNRANEKEFLKRLQAQQDQHFKEQDFKVNHPVRAAGRDVLGSFTRALGRGFRTSRTKGKLT